MRGIKKLMIACHLHVSFKEHAVHFQAVYGILMNTEKTGAYSLYFVEPKPLGRHCCLFFLPSPPSVHQKCWEYPRMMDRLQRNKNKRPNGSFKADLQRVKLSLVAYLIPRAPRKDGWLPWASGVCSDLRHCWNRSVLGDETENSQRGPPEEMLDLHSTTEQTTTMSPRTI